MTIKNKTNRNEQNSFSLKTKLISILILVLFSSVTITAQKFGFEWNKTFEYTPYSTGDALTVDSEGNVISTGNFRTMLVFNNDTITSNRYYSMFIAKYDTYGNYMWVKTISSDNYIRLYSACVDENDNIYFAGFYTGIWEDGEINMQAVHGSDACLLSFDKNGNYRWAKSAGGMGADFQWFVETDNNGGVYTVGTHYWDDFVVSDEIVLDHFGAYIIKYNSEGDALWASNFGGDIHSLTGGLYADEEEVIVSGLAMGKMLLDTTLYTENIAGTLVKFSLNGEYIETILFGANECDACGSSGISKDIEKNLYVTGSFEGDITIGDTMLTMSDETNDQYIAKFDKHGGKEWVIHIESSGGIRGSGEYRLKNSNNKLFFAFECDSSVIIGDTILESTENSAYLIKFSDTGDIQEVFKGTSSWGVEINDLEVFTENNILNLYFIGTFGTDLVFPGIELNGFNHNTYYINKYSLELPEIPDTLEYYNNLLIYPNPSNGFFNIKYKDISPNQIILNIYDIKGKHLFSKSYLCSDNNLIENINISTLANGLYLLKVHYANTVIYRKLIISR